MNKKVAVVMGTRPEAIKLAPIILALEKSEDLVPLVVSTGQHREMLSQVIDQFQIQIDIDFGLMQKRQTLADLSSRLLPAVDQLILETNPDFIIAQGDTTTVLMTALAAFYRGVPFGHVEAGLRTDSIRSPFPEEANRRLVSPLSTLHFAPTRQSRSNLLKEGYSSSSVYVTGNSVIDSLKMEVEFQKSTCTSALDTFLASTCGFDLLEEQFVLITGHRRENFGDGFEQICSAIRHLAREFPEHYFLYPVHLNPNVREPVHSLLRGLPNVSLVDPLPYRPFVRAMSNCAIVLTDSGGVQEEAPSLGKPVLVMRDNTERPEGVDAGTVRLVGSGNESIIEAVTYLLTDSEEYQRMASSINPYGDGETGKRIVSIVRDYLSVH